MCVCIYQVINYVDDPHRSDFLFFFVYVANSLPLSNASIFNKIVGTFALRLVGVFAMCDIA